MKKIFDGEVIYRDGKPVTDRPQREIVEIHFNHVTPDHDDYNPGEATAGAASVVARIIFAKFEATRESQSEAGRGRVKQKRLLAAEKQKAIQRAENKLRGSGITRNLNKLIASETELKTDYVKKNRRPDRVGKRGRS